MKWNDSWVVMAFVENWISFIFGMIWDWCLRLGVWSLFGSRFSEWVENVGLITITEVLWDSGVDIVGLEEGSFPPSKWGDESKLFSWRTLGSSRNCCWWVDTVTFGEFPFVFSSSSPNNGCLILPTVSCGLIVSYN